MDFARPDRSQARPAPHPEYFEGRVLMQPLLSQSTELELIAVFFEAGARTIPHVHATDQVLWVVEGRCRVVDGEQRRELGPGECVVVPAGRWHWHGAAAGAPACHVSIRQPGTTDWTVERRDFDPPEERS
ncbi:MAG TPA: cupin domain-containing protein [Candidatus Polarisedimenticolaceae bacterium]|nr:cupin domain-containing protein [Candidatus Polarisedimenticolaceae bacterium]